MQRFSTCLWFDHQAEEAARFYTAVFRNARVTSTSHYSEAGQEIHGRPPGTVVTVEFELEGQAFVALNGGPHVAFTPAISFMVNCDTAAEVDALWSRLADGGIPLMALDSYPFSDRYGWIQDRYGVSWQLILGQGAARQKIMPVLMFVGRKYGKAEEAIRFYTSVFPNAKAGNIFRYGPGQTLDRPEAVAYADFELDRRLFAVMESGYDHRFDFSEAISFIVHCRDQREVDDYWDKLAADPADGQCGWLKDRYGVSWQIVPTVLYQLLRDADAAQSQRVMRVLLQMRKLDIDGLQRAYDHV